MSNATAIGVMRTALQQFHYTESPAGSNNTKYGRWYGCNHEPWCSIYEVWCGAHADGDNPIARSTNAGDVQDLTVKNKGGKYVMQKTRSNATKAEGMKKAKFGDIGSFDFGANDGWRDHTALYVGDGYFIEGNTSFDEKGDQSNGGAVAYKKRPSNYICCYVRPKYKKKDFYKPTKSYTGKIPKLPADGSFKYGDKGASDLQDALSWANGYKIDGDGKVGSYTFAEIVIFQVTWGLVPDGVFGKKSHKKLVELIESLADTPQKPPESPKTDEKTEDDILHHPKLYKAKNGDLCYDLSNHQGKLSLEYFKGLKRQGVKCVILRSSYTLMAKFQMFEDAAFIHNIKNAIKAGLHIGIYHFSSAVNPIEAKKEAKFCLKIIEPYAEHIDLPVAFDCEFGFETKNGKPRFTSKVAESIGRSGIGDIVEAFYKEVKKAGYTFMLYANLSMFTDYMPKKIHEKYLIWVAQYYSKCQYKHPYYLWQYTSTNGKLDKNKFGSQLA